MGMTPVQNLSNIDPDGVRRAYDKLGIPIGQDVQDLLETAPARKPGDFWRNHMGAPYVLHPTETKKDGSPKRVVYGRPSSFGTALDNAYNLVKWKERQLLIGVGRLIDGEGFPEFEEDDRTLLDGLAARCHAYAGSSLAADRGTHVHLLLERFDRGHEVDDLMPLGQELGIPRALQGRICNQWIAFRYKLGVGVEPVAIEATVVHDGWRLAGTLDRLDVADRDTLTGLGVIPAGQAFIGDIKTGSLTLGRDGQPNYWVKYPVQLAAYAGGVGYDVDTDERFPLGWSSEGDYINQEIALIYHYDLATALEGVPVDWQAIPVNLQAGREGGDLCRLAADFAKRRDLFLMPAPVSVGVVPEAAIPTTPTDENEESCSDTTPTSNPATPTTSTITSTQDSSTSSKDSITASTTPAPSTTSTSSPKTSSTSTSERSSESPDAGPTCPSDDFQIVADDGRRGRVTIKSSRTQLRASLARLIDAGHEDVIRRLWPAGVPPLSQPGHTVEQLTQLFYLVRRVEAEVGAPFDPEPPVYPTEPGDWELIPASPAAPPDDGAFLDTREIDTLKARMLALPDDRIVILADIAREANDAGRPISVQQKPCVRRWEIARALVLWAEGGTSLDHLALGVSAVATRSQIAGNDTVGAVISQFTIEQATRLADSFEREVAA